MRVRRSPALCQLPASTAGRLRSSARGVSPSVRFLGRRVYLGAIVTLISAMRQGPTPRRVRELSTVFGADRATIARWQAFWRDHIPQTPFWKVARARLIPVVDVALL